MSTKEKIKLFLTLLFNVEYKGEKNEDYTIMYNRVQSTYFILKHLFIFLCGVCVTMSLCRDIFIDDVINTKANIKNDVFYFEDIVGLCLVVSLLLCTLILTILHKKYWLCLLSILCMFFTVTCKPCIYVFLLVIIYKLYINYDNESDSDSDSEK